MKKTSIFAAVLVYKKIVANEITRRTDDAL